MKGSALVERVVESPNFAERVEPVRFVVLHGTWMASDEEAIKRLCDRVAEVSAHYVITRAGEIVQLVGEDQVAWHAGKSVWQGVEGLNRCSIGIEIGNGGDGTGEKASPVQTVEPYGEVQYERVIALLKDILRRQGLGPEAVVRHSEVSPGRKTDPGAHFDWGRLVSAGVAVARG